MFFKKENECKQCRKLAKRCQQLERENMELEARNEHLIHCMEVTHGVYYCSWCRKVLVEKPGIWCETCKTNFAYGV